MGIKEEAKKAYEEELRKIKGQQHLLKIQRAKERAKAKAKIVGYAKYGKASAAIRATKATGRGLKAARKGLAKAGASYAKHSQQQRKPKKKTSHKKKSRKKSRRTSSVDNFWEDLWGSSPF
jgi:hypothetical protein